MAKIRFIEHDGTEIVADVPTGRTMMEGARENNVSGIVADCGGACACSTCHVYVRPDWVDKLPPIGDLEANMLEFALDYHPEKSRLTCQIVVSDALDGLVVDVPEDQM